MKKIKQNWNKFLIMPTLATIFIGGNSAMASNNYTIFKDSIYFGAAVAKEPQKRIVIIHTKDAPIMSCHLSSSSGKKAVSEFSAALKLHEAEKVELAIGDFNINFKNKKIRDGFIKKLAAEGFYLELDHLLPYSISKQRGGTFNNAQVTKVNLPAPKSVKDLSIKITRKSVDAAMLNSLINKWDNKFSTTKFKDLSFGEYSSDHIFSRVLGKDEVTIAWNAISTQISTKGKELIKDGENQDTLQNAANKFSNTQWRILAKALNVNNIPDAAVDLNDSSGHKARNDLKKAIDNKWNMREYYDANGKIHPQHRDKVIAFVKELYTKMHDHPDFIAYNNSFKTPYTSEQLAKQKEINSSHGLLVEESYKSVFKVLNTFFMGTVDETLGEKFNPNSVASYINPLVYQGYEGFTVPEGTQQDLDLRQLIEFMTHVLEDAEKTKYTDIKKVNLNIIEATEANHTKAFYRHCEELIELAKNDGISSALQKKLQEFLELQKNIVQKPLLLQEGASKIAKNPEMYREVYQDLKIKGITLEDEIADMDNSDEHVAKLETKDKALLFVTTLSNVTEKDIQDNKNNLSINSALSEVVSKIAVVNVNTRIQSLAVASGDEEKVKPFAPHGVWVSSTFSKSHQKAYNTVLGYKGKSSGWTIGVDAMIKDAHTIGLAYSKGFSSIIGSKSNVNKAKANSDILSLYGKISLNNNCDIDLIASGNITKITHQYDKLVGLNSYQLTTGKFRSNGFHLQSMFSYKLQMNNGLIITPNIGMHYSNQNDASYNETGAGVHNSHVAASHYQQLVGKIGTKISKSFNSRSVQIIPSLMASIENNFINNKKKIKVRYLWAENFPQESLNTGKESALGYNLGTNLAVLGDFLEVSATYNCNLKKNYIQHQGALKLKFLF